MHTKIIKGIEYVYDGKKCLGRKDKLPTIAESCRLNKLPSELLELLSDSNNPACYSPSTVANINHFLTEVFIHQLETYVRSGAVDSDDVASLASVIRENGISVCVLDQFLRLVEYNIAKRQVQGHELHLIKAICREPKHDQIS